MSKKEQSDAVLHESFWKKYNSHLSSDLSIPSKVSSTAQTTLKQYFDKNSQPKPTGNNELAVALRSPFSHKDITKSYEFIRYVQASEKGMFITNNQIDKTNTPIDLKGADNWGNVMCYFDSLLFSMFSKLESFEPMLFQKNSDPKVEKLRVLLRFYVSLLRSGQLITTDITKKICETLFDLGFEESMSQKQEDVAPLFQFLTEVLSMPLLTLRIDIAHGGKFNKDDDQRFTKERILFVSIPEDIEEDENENGENEVLLEECLEHYFNNSVEVKRELERRATLESLRRISSSNVTNYDAGVVTYGTLSEKEEHLQVENADGDTSLNTPIEETNEVISFPEMHSECAVEEDTITLNNDTPPPTTRRRRTTNNRGTFSSAKMNSVLVSARERSSTFSIWSLNRNKEVTLPAWMFLQLLPFYTDDDNQKFTKNSKEFIERRPVLPICLKRYSYDDSKASRSKTRIVIPSFIDLPQFIADDTDAEPFGSFKLVLESAICHRGSSINSGHFVSVVRKNDCNLFASEDEENETIWYLYDDMKKRKVRESTFKEIFNTEWPYMLFYRMVPFNDDKLKKEIIVPRGSKTSYWDLPKENVRESTISSNSKDTLVSEHLSDFSLLTPTSSISKQAASGSNHHHHHHHIFKNPAISSTELDSIASQSTIPLPSDSKYIDIRDKYFWYTKDVTNAYVKEEMPTLNVATADSVKVSPQLRRVSGGSEISNMSNSFLSADKRMLSKDEDLKHVDEHLSKLSVSSNGSASSFWKKTIGIGMKKTQSNVHSTEITRIHSPIEEGHHESNLSKNEFKVPQVPKEVKTTKIVPTELKSPKIVPTDMKSPKLTASNITSPKLEAIDLRSGKKKEKKEKKKSNRKRDKYKDEKCVIV